MIRLKNAKSRMAVTHTHTQCNLIKETINVINRKINQNNIYDSG